MSVAVPQRKGPDKIIDTDEHPRPGLTIEALAKLRPAFKKDGGTVTAGNASGINDGAAAIILISGKKANELGIEPMAKVSAYTSTGVEAEIMGYGPVPAVEKLLEKTGLTIADIDLFEINEAFAAQYFACEKLLNLPREKTNVNGSGVAMGHPVGCTGSRITITLLYEMIRRDVKRGVASLCGMGGVATALLIERE